MRHLFSTKNNMNKNNILFIFISLCLLFFTLPAYANKNEIINIVSARTISSAKDKASVNKNIKPLLKNSNSYLLQLFSGLLVVLVSIITLAWIAKRFNRMSSGNNSGLKIIGGINMGSRERIVIVQAGEAKLVLGVSTGRINLLHVLDSGDYSDKEKTDNVAGKHDSVSISDENIRAAEKIKLSDASSNHKYSFSQNLAAALLRKKS